MSSTLPATLASTVSATTTTRRWMRVTDESRRDDAGRCLTLTASDTWMRAGSGRGLTTLVMVEGERRVGGKTTVESRYYISSTAE